jgi:hypothetical protein
MVGEALGRAAGVGFACFGLACRPAGGSGAPGPSARHAMVVFQAGVAAVLAITALGAGLAGPLLWPAVAYHAVAAILLARDIRRGVGRPGALPEGKTG